MDQVDSLNCKVFCTLLCLSIPANFSNKHHCRRQYHLSNSNKIVSDKITNEIMLKLINFQKYEQPTSHEQIMPLQ
jgi:hypothetical protein